MANTPFDSQTTSADNYHKWKPAIFMNIHECTQCLGFFLIIPRQWFLDFVLSFFFLIFCFLFYLLRTLVTMLTAVTVIPIVLQQIQWSKTRGLAPLNFMTWFLWTSTLISMAVGTTLLVLKTPNFPLNNCLITITSLIIIIKKK